MDEYIRREDAIKCIEGQCVDGKMWGNDESEGTLIESYSAIDDLMEIPPADVAPVVHGRWEFKDDDGAYPWTTKAICSECKKVIAWNARLSLKNNQIEFAHENHYCLNCGAIMDGGSD